MPVDRFCPRPSIDNAPATLTVTLPALPVPPNEFTDISPFVTILRLPAATVMLPALPVLSVSAVIPVGTVDDVPSIDSAPATVTAISPPLPIPKVSVAIWPLGLIDSEPAVTEMLPALPVLSVSAVIPVGTVDDVPSIDIAPATVTAMVPPLPVPNVSVVICPFGVIDNDPALTVMLPEFPVAAPVLSGREIALMPVRTVCETPSIDRAPATLTAMLPPLPKFSGVGRDLAIGADGQGAGGDRYNAAVSGSCGVAGNAAETRQLQRPALTLTSPALPSPRASLDIVPPLMIDILPAATLTLPALPLLPGSASVVIPVRNWDWRSPRRWSARRRH